MSNKAQVVAIDGPVGVGKSSVAKQVAKQLNYTHLDTGAMYRAVTLKYLRLPESQRSGDALAEIAQDLRLDPRPDGSLYCDGEDITQQIRTEEVSAKVYLAADDFEVRKALVAEQQRLGRDRPSVLEGRDITTVVFPDAQWRIYLDASPKVRAQRRFDQLSRQEAEVDFEQVYAGLLERDERDRAREQGALTLCPTALVVDTTGLSEDRVIELIVQIVLQSNRAAG